MPPLQLRNHLVHKYPCLSFRHNALLLHDCYALVDHGLHRDRGVGERTILKTEMAVIVDAESPVARAKIFGFFQGHTTTLAERPLWHRVAHFALPPVRYAFNVSMPFILLCVGRSDRFDRRYCPYASMYRYVFHCCLPNAPAKLRSPSKKEAIRQLQPVVSLDYGIFAIKPYNTFSQHDMYSLYSIFPHSIRSPFTLPKREANSSLYIFPS